MGARGAGHRPRFRALGVDVARMHVRAWIVPVVVLAGACGRTQPQTPRGAVDTPRVAEAERVTAAPASPAQAVEPTPRTEAQKARERALAPGVEAILDAFGNHEPRLSPDGKRVLFVSNRDGSPELFVADATNATSPARKVVPSPERALDAKWSRDGRYILFRRDTGADENFRIYRATPDGSDVAPVTTDEAMHRDGALLPRARPNVVYTARKTSSPETRLFVAPLEGGEPKVVAKDSGPSFGVAVSNDGNRVLLLRFVSPSNQVLLEADVGTGAVKQVYPREGGSAGISSAEYSADGKRIFVATDGGGESSLLLALDASYAEVARYVEERPRTALLSELAVSPRGDRIAVAVDAGNRSEMRILDARNLRHARDVKLPLGAASLGAFSEDGRRVTLTVAVPDAPGEAYVADATTGALSKLRDDPRKGLSSLPPIEVTLGATPAHDGLSIPVHAYLPKARPSGGRLPVFVHFHGGPASTSSVSWNWMARALTSEGYAFVEPNIRGSRGFGRAFEMADNRDKRADALRDVETVNAWLRAQPWADPNRLVILGGSYGGYLVLMGLTRQPTLWSAGVDLVGPADLRTFLESTDQAIRTAFVDEFGDVEKDAALLEEFSPMRDKDKIVAPLFVYQGQNDPRVPRSESDQIVASLRARGVPVEYMVAPDEGHSMDRRTTRVEFATRVVRFLEEHR